MLEGKDLGGERVVDGPQPHREESNVGKDRHNGHTHAHRRPRRQQ